MFAVVHRIKLLDLSNTGPHATIVM
uniref:Uncharacterized protein n=1 Tax=Arundo donax TaxID=35708 RepID=A0A0A8ZDF8_ARUDO